MNDIQLCLKVRDGDRDAAETIQQRHAGLIKRVIKQHFPKLCFQKLRGTIADDVKQCGRIGLHLAAIKYDGARGSFSSYACRRIHTEISRMFTRTYRSDYRCGMHGRCVSSKSDYGLTRKKNITIQSGEESEIINIISDRHSSPESLIDRLSPLPRVVCRLLASGRDPVKSLGLYEGELDRIRIQAFAEVG